MNAWGGSWVNQSKASYWREKLKVKESKHGKRDEILRNQRKEVSWRLSSYCKKFWTEEANWNRETMKESIKASR